MVHHAGGILMYVYVSLKFVSPQILIADIPLGIQHLSNSLSLIPVCKTVVILDQPIIQIVIVCAAEAWFQLEIFFLLPLLSWTSFYCYCYDSRKPLFMAILLL